VYKYNACRVKVVEQYVVYDTARALLLPDEPGERWSDLTLTYAEMGDCSAARPAEEQASGLVRFSDSILPGLPSACKSPSHA
jgi:hypothetical protein